MSQPTREQVNHALLYGARVAPSQLGGEERPGKQMPVGPAGLPIPAERAIYRKTIDSELLGRIVKVAHGAWAASRLPMPHWEATADTLTADIASRYPAAEMAVLAKYGHAKPIDIVAVQIRGGFSHAPVRLEMVAPRTLPHRATYYVADLTEQPPCADPHVPAATLEFFRVWDEIARAKKADFINALGWPGQFKNKEGRWPRWFEIEKAWPKIGAWLRDQRQALRRT
ncbi:hypothetical protein SAMN06295912_1355 [Sphingomonas laterariae]|uniref:Uncharacterized protein n=1 Tax=Edaphosphingomonas laterariae TaxID=861865 RepID=A0A239JHJ7_9SPHN|nr:hypothetical protein [Sphingomonas laterariae]SNT05279.1 hypothetical protein SAMN06295912_1355 [Sphingomonas laterariae]